MKKCQSLSEASGQPCKLNAIEDGNFCKKHQALMVGSNKTHGILAGRFQSRIDAHAGDKKLKTLRGEIGILRIILEDIVKKCDNADDILLEADRLQALTKDIAKLVLSCHQLEVSSGILLSKDSLMAIADGISGVIGDYIEDKEVLGEVALKICSIIQENDEF